MKKSQDDRLIYAKHNVHINDDENDIIDLTDEEIEESLDGQGITIKDGDSEDNIDLGEEF